MKSKTTPYHGRNLLKWCKSCNLPWVGSKICNKCNGSTEEVTISPPYDFRPAQKYDLKLLNKLVTDIYGEKGWNIITQGQEIIILNHVSSQERAEEIIISGQVVGFQNYNMLNNEWEFKPRTQGALLLHQKGIKKRIVVDSGATKPIKEKGASVLAPGVIKIDNGLKKNDFCFICNEENDLLAIGRLKIDPEEIILMKKGVVASNEERIKVCLAKVNSSEKPTWEEAISYHKDVIESWTEKAHHFIKGVMNKFKLPNAVSFSGGKDSLVTLDLVYKALKDSGGTKVLFANTGLEFPETLEYIEEIIAYYNLEDDYITLPRSDELFWETARTHGPPGRDFRYCCKFSKLGPIQDMINTEFDSKVLSFVGQRRYESKIRAESGPIWSNPWIPNQINASPIQDWPAMLIWLYTWYNDLPSNPLYERGYARIGCWLCPANSLNELELLKETHPDMAKELFSFLEKWREENNLPKLWIDYGLWRYKNTPTKIKQHLEHHNISYAPEKKPKIEHIQKILIGDGGISPCLQGGYSIEGRIIPSPQLESVNMWLTVAGRNNFSKDLGMIYVKKGKNTSFQLFSDGTWKARITYEKDLDFIINVLESVYRYAECNGCSACVGSCPQKALSLSDKENRLIIDEETCIHCFECSSHCPIITFLYRDELAELKDKLHSDFGKIINK
jgi:phosphoadenosine phosphosulfate reductase